MLPQLMHGPGDFSPFVNVGAIAASDEQQKELAERGVRSTETAAILQLKQLFFLKKMSNSLENIEGILGKSLLFDREQAKSDKMSGLERDRESKGGKSVGMVAAIAGGVAKLGLKALAASFLFGVLGGLTRWGKDLLPILDKIKDGAEWLQWQFDRLGVIVEHLTGSESLGKLTRMVPLLATVMGAAYLLLRNTFLGKAVGAVARGVGAAVKAGGRGVVAVAETANAAKGGGFLAKSADFFKTGAQKVGGKALDAISPMLKSFGGLAEGGGIIAKFAPILRGVGTVLKAVPFLGQVIMAIEGIIGAVKGFFKGFKEGGLVEGLKQAVLGGIDGIIGGLVDLVIHLIGSISSMLGFEEFGEKLKNFKFSKMMDMLLVSFGYGIELLLYHIGNISDSIRNGIGDVIKSMADAVAKVPLVGDKLATPMYRASIAVRPDNKNKRQAPEAPDFGKMMDDMYTPDPTTSAPKAESSGPTSAAASKPTMAQDLARVDAQHYARQSAAQESRAPRAASNVTSTESILSNAGTSMGLAGERVSGEGKMNSSVGGNVGNLLDLIAKGESGRAGYDAYYNGSKVRPPKPLSTMTVGEVKAWQRSSVNAGSASSAAGRYQFIRKTLEATQKSAGVTDDMLFNSKTQDALAIALLNSNKRDGLNAWVAKKTTDARFIDWVASQWASIKNSSGRGTYDHDGLNHAGISGGSVIAALNGQPTNNGSYKAPMSGGAPKMAPTPVASATSGSMVATASAATSPATLASASTGGNTTVNAPTTNVNAPTIGKSDNSTAFNAVTPPTFAPMVV